MFMADSLNKFFEDAGKAVSENLFGNKSQNPAGSTRFSGAYLGPGGGINRPDLKGVDNLDGIKVNKSEKNVTRIAAFTPVGYFDKTNQWIDDKLSSIIDYMPGIIKARDKSGIGTSSDKDGFLFPNDIDTTKGTLNLAKPQGPYQSIGDGFIPPGFFDPDSEVWVDIRLSRKIEAFLGADWYRKNGTNRTDLPNITKDSPKVSSEMGGGVARGLENPDNDGNIDWPGFTPVYYYRSGDEILLKPKISKINEDSFSNEIGIVSNKEAKDYVKKTGKDGFYENTESSDYRFKFGLEDDQNVPGISTKTNERLKQPVTYKQTPYDNEDPLYTGFEIIINTKTSPLFNGEAAKFISLFSPNNEIASRGKILKDFIKEMERFFKFNTNPTIGSDEPIFVTTDTRKRHYVKKVNGINKLVEANSPSAQAAFVKYRNDLLTLAFYEDTTLELGTLMSLYKSLYWSRLNGKNIIPENLLRFDCKLIVSEVRNLTRVKLATDTGDIKTIKENVSRYIYDLYECQLFFDKMSHGDAVSMETMTATEATEVNFSWKYSTMRFERYDFKANGGEGVYKFIDNKQLTPHTPTPTNSDGAVVTENEITHYSKSIMEPLNNGYSGKDITTSIVSDRFNALQESLSKLSGDQTIPNLESNEKLNLYNASFEKSILSGNEFSSSPNVYTQREISEENSIPSNKDSLFKKAGQRLLQNVKKAALNEAQRQLNNQFRLVNNSLDKVRNSFGIGRMREPTNVYNNLPNAQFFFDVKNSLRDFGGDVLGGLLGG